MVQATKQEGAGGIHEWTNRWREEYDGAAGRRGTPREKSQGPLPPQSLHSSLTLPWEEPFLRQQASQPDPRDDLPTPFLSSEKISMS